MDKLTARSLQIRDEVQDAANTARRVGSLLADIVAAIRAATDRALSRESPDTAHGHITFADGLTSQAAMHTNGTLTIGKENADGKAPTQFAPDGTGEMNALTLRGALRVAELQINKLTATAGEWILTESAVIESVVPAPGDGNSYTITLRREHKADFVPFIPGDILKGIINTLALRALHPEDTPTAPAPHATFATAWLLVESVDLDSLTLTARRYADADVPAPPSYVPVPQMRLARWGHLRDKARQSLLLLSSPEGRILHLQGVNAPGYRPADVAASFGTVPEFLKSLLGNALAPERDYAFVRGLIAQDIIMLDRDRLPIPQTVDRGVWAAATTYYAKERNPQTLLYEISDVWHQGARYRALITSTGVEPGTPASATRWLLIQAAPKDGTPGAAGKDGRDGLNYAANLLDGTAFENLGAWAIENNGASIDPARQCPIPGTHAVQILCPRGAYAGMSQLITARLLPSTTYTLSVYSIATAAGAGELMIYPTPARALRVNVTTQWTRHYFTFTTPAEFSAGWVRCFLRLYFKKDAPDNVVYFAAPKLEAGEAPTEWCPSELDRKGTPGKDGRDGLTPLPNLLDGTAFAESKLTSWKINLEHTGGKFERTDTYAALAGCSVVQGSLPLEAAKAGHYVEITQSLQRFVPGRTYTFSVWAKGTAAVWLIVYPNPGTHYEATELKNDQWTRVFVSFTATEDTTPTSAVLRVRARGSSPIAGDVFADLCAPKLEEGPVPTPWSPSENDRKGAPGARGAVLRMRGVWSGLPDGTAFESGATGEEFLDVVSVETDGGLLHYHCTQTHTKTAANAPGPDSAFWKLGATFDLVATRLLLADKANIGKWYISNGNIVSRREDNPETYISLDAPRNVITLQRYFPASQTRRTLSLTATTGSLECSVDKYDSGRHYVSSTTVDDMGISVARAVTPSEGVQINETEGFVKGFISARITAPHGLTVPTAAVYGAFTDKTGGPVHGGWFTNLHAQGISLGARIISKNSQLESRSPFNVITQSTVCSMPYTHREGEMIFVRQVDGSTVLNALSNDVFWIPEGPAPIYRNEIAIGAGELFVLTFLRAPYHTNGHYDNDLTIRVWLLTKSTAGRM